MQNQRIEIDGCPVNIHTDNTKDSFRTEITPLTDANPETIKQVYQRATAWTRQFRSGQNNSSLRCFRDGRNVIVEDLSGTITQPEMQQLGEFLQRSPTTAAGAGGSGETSDAAGALTG